MFDTLRSAAEAVEFFLADRGLYMLIFLLLAVGVFGMVVCGNYMKKLMCMNVMQVSIILFFLTFGQKVGGTLPITMSGLTEPDAYLNPLPHALMLTAIVVSLGTTGVGLALLMKMQDLYGTIEESEITGRGEKIDIDAERDERYLPDRDDVEESAGWIRLFWHSLRGADGARGDAADGAAGAAEGDAGGDGAAEGGADGGAFSRDAAGMDETGEGGDGRD